jgi:fructoselysine 6-phosphate deglycase
VTVNSLDTEALFFTSLVTPNAIRRVVTDLEPVIADIAAGIAATRSPRLYFLGGGASLAAMLGGAYLLDRFTSVPAQAATGWQFLSRQPHAVDENAVVVLTSYSGETPEILEAKNFAESRGAKTIAITNAPETPVAQGATAVFDYQSKAVFTAPLAIVYLLAARIMEQRGENAAIGSQIAAGLAELPAKMALQAERTQAPARESAATVGDVDVFYVVGSGPNYGLGYKLALSVIIENLWKDAVPVDAGEFYHGPIEIVPRAGAAGDKRAFLHLVGTDPSRAVSEQAIAFCRKLGARQLIFDAADYPEFGELFAPFALFVPTEWWVMHMAAQKGHDVDERRWMGKIGARWGEYA